MPVELAPPLDRRASEASGAPGTHGCENLHQRAVGLRCLEGVGNGDRASRRDGEGVQMRRGTRVVLDRLGSRDIRGPRADPEAAGHLLGDRRPPTGHRTDAEVHVAELAETLHLDDQVIVGVRADEEERGGELRAGRGVDPEPATC